MIIEEYSTDQYKVEVLGDFLLLVTDTYNDEKIRCMIEPYEDGELWIGKITSYLIDALIDREHDRRRQESFNGYGWRP